MEGEDPTLELTGTEEQPLRTASGPACPATKALICHIPPGNPANAHTICVGKPAVRAHVSHHNDVLGACGDDPAKPESPAPPSNPNSDDLDPDPSSTPDEIL